MNTFEGKVSGFIVVNNVNAKQVLVYSGQK